MFSSRVPVRLDRIGFGGTAGEGGFEDGLGPGIGDSGQDGDLVMVWGY